MLLSWEKQIKSQRCEIFINIKIKVRPISEIQKILMKKTIDEFYLISFSTDDWI